MCYLTYLVDLESGGALDALPVELRAAPRDGGPEVGRRLGRPVRRLERFLGRIECFALHVRHHLEYHQYGNPLIIIRKKRIDFKVSGGSTVSAQYCECAHSNDDTSLHNFLFPQFEQA